MYKNEHFKPSNELFMFILKNVVNRLNIEDILNNDTVKSQIEATISHSITNFIATLGRALVYGSQKTFTIMNDGQFTKEFMAGILFRIPLKKDNLSLFNSLLTQDFKTWLKEDQQVGQYSIVHLENDNIQVVNIAPIEKPIKTDWVRATVFVPE